MCPSELTDYNIDDLQCVPQSSLGDTEKCCSTKWSALQMNVQTYIGIWGPKTQKRQQVPVRVILKAVTGDMLTYTA
jgi:hypothetical protein